MNDTVHISGEPPARISENYALLREGGMEWIRRWARDSWTDHNIHDPGISMLEAACYAMTEMGLRLQLDVADLLRSGEARAPAVLEPGHRVLPVGPVNTQDLRCVLLDHPLVSDAQIFRPAENEVAFYEAAGNPPLAYVQGPGRLRVRTSGLYEVLVELADTDLNSNTYARTLVSGAVTYDIEIGLPFWDDEEAAPFRTPANLTSIAMIVDTGEFWRALPESQSFYGKLNVSYTDSSGTPGSVEIWTLLRITTPLAQPALVIPQILIDARTAIESIAAGSPLNVFADRVRRAAQSVRRLDNYVAGWRNLGEHAVSIGLVRVQEIAINARIEVTGGIDVESLLATVLMDIDGLLSPLTRFESLADRRRQSDDPDIIFDGPLLRRGFIDRGKLTAPRVGVLYASDVLRLIMQRRSSASGDVVTQENPVGRDIVAVTSLTLANFINNRPITTDAEDCLHFVEVDRYRPRLSVPKSRITVVRNDTEVTYDPNLLQTKFRKLKDDARAAAVTADASPLWPVSRGDALPVGDFTPLQQELPAAYGVGAAVLPDSAGPQRRAAADQLKGYLMLFEQQLGDMTEQLANLNLFFSGDAGETPTYPVRPPFDLPGAPRLLRRFDGSVPWEDFIASPSNPVILALREAAESRERLLDRRNRMLDHLLARQGEDAVGMGQELHRWAQVELVASSLAPADKEARIRQRREAANARLLRIKSTLLRELPELAAFRFLANTNPFTRDSSMIVVEPQGTAFRWRLDLAGLQLRAIGTDPTVTEAAIAAERAASFAARESNYRVVVIGGQRRLQLLEGPGIAAVQLGESVQTFGSVADANSALASLATAFSSFRIANSLSPMERRLAHHAGVRDARRRRSMTPVNDHFEIFAVPAGPGLFGRRWRLRDATGGAGNVLLTSAVQFDAPVAADAEQLARASIPAVLRFGADEWNYVMLPGTFDVELRDPTGAVLGRLPATPADAESARAAITLASEFLNRAYGDENFHLVEHQLLRPRATTDPFLALPLGESTSEQDPYSHRLSLVFCSGHSRDFTSILEAPPLSDVSPARFRDPEFRRHVEAMVQRLCPAHLLPTIYWVDREVGGIATVPGSFDSFEERYFAWLDTVLIPGASESDITLARNRLVVTLNEIADDAG